MTVTELLIQALEGCDEMISAMVLMRTTDGTIRIMTTHESGADDLGMLRFAQVSAEYDMQERWRMS
jgi:hypothetical protein